MVRMCLLGLSSHICLDVHMTAVAANYVKENGWPLQVSAAVLNGRKASTNKNIWQCKMAARSVQRLHQELRGTAFEQETAVVLKLEPAESGNALHNLMHTQTHVIMSSTATLGCSKQADTCDHLST